MAELRLIPWLCYPRGVFEAEFLKVTNQNGSWLLWGVSHSYRIDTNQTLEIN